MTWRAPPSGCAKRRYPSEESAARALSKVRLRARRGVRRRREQRFYVCAVCGGWHLTSMKAHDDIEPELDP